MSIISLPGVMKLIEVINAEMFSDLKHLFAIAHKCVMLVRAVNREVFARLLFYLALKN